MSLMQGLQDEQRIKFFANLRVSPRTHQALAEQFDGHGKIGCNRGKYSIFAIAVRQVGRKLFRDSGSPTNRLLRSSLTLLQQTAIPDIGFFQPLSMGSRQPSVTGADVG